MKLKIIKSIFLSLMLFCISQTMFSIEKKALVIGNSNYQYFNSLRTPAQEARDMSASLRRLGFDVTLLLDATLEDMIDALYELEASVNTGDLCLFHYGGHGVQSAGENYLVPVDADISDERKLRTRALNLAEVMSSLEISGSDTNIVIIDACRDNPIPGMTRSGTRGLAVTANPPGNSIIIYSAQAGSTATDGVFTPTLLKYLEQPLRLADILLKVQKDVQEQTNRQQRPGSYSELIAPVYLNGELQGSVAVEDIRESVQDGFVKIDSAWFEFYGSVGDWYVNEFDYSDPANHHTTWLASFYASPYEVTFDEYDEFCNATGWYLPDDEGWGRGRRPVIHVSFSDIIAYANWASEQAGLDPCFTKDGEDYYCDFSKNGYRLPTVAEWEYLARDGGKMVSMPWGMGKPYGNLPDESLLTLEPSEYGTIRVGGKEESWSYKSIKLEDIIPGYNDGYIYTAPVGSFHANSLGMYDLEGNVTEYCWDGRWDWYSFDWQNDVYDPELYKQRNPTGPDITDIGMRSRRGSSWAFIFNVNQDYEDSMWSDKTIFIDVGFRLVRTAVQ